MGRTTFKKKITSEDKIEKINPLNKQLIEQFLKAKKRTCSEATIKTYRSDLTIFFCWLVDNDNNIFYTKVKKRDISDFFSFIQDELQCNGRRFAHFRSVLSELSSFCIKYYDDDELGNFRNFIKDIIETPDKSPSRERIILTQEDCESILKLLEDEDRVQEACLFACGIYSGMRISELEQMKVEYFSDDKLAYDGVFYKTATIRTKGRKGGKYISRLVIYELFKPYLEKWLKERAKILKDKGIDDHGYLFVNRSGYPATQDVIRGFVAKWGNIIDKELHPHVMRHRFTTYLQEIGCSDSFIQAVVNWQSIELVSLYSDKTEEDKEWDEIGQLKNMFR